MTQKEEAAAALEYVARGIEIGNWVLNPALCKQLGEEYANDLAKVVPRDMRAAILTLKKGRGRMTKRELDLVKKIEETGPLKNYNLTKQEGRVFRRLARKGLVVAFDTSPRPWLQRWRQLKDFLGNYVLSKILRLLDYLSWVFWVILGCITGVIICFLIEAQLLR